MAAISLPALKQRRSRSGCERFYEVRPFPWQLLLVLPLRLLAQTPNDCDEQVSPQIRVDSGHPWRPPFGLERVGAPIGVRVELVAEQALRNEYSLVAYRDGSETERKSLQVSGDKPSFFAATELSSLPHEVALLARCPGRGQAEEIKRQAVHWPEVEADAEARPDRQINPVDLGTVLVPHDWLLLAGGQTAMLDVAAISRTRNIPDARLRAWFRGGKPVDIGLPLRRDQRTSTTLTLPFSASGDRSVLHVTLIAGSRELWKKDIHTMIVSQLPSRPTFGAVETKLRYDSSISVKDRKSGKYSSINYEQGWDPQLNDVAVFLPNGARFVFWRGSSYVPFWAGLYNTGLSYQWAETVPPTGYIDCVEPLQDKELRFGRVRIMESTPSRVHVRWTYESVDVEYKALGDQAFEDFYFYPDGFGTRVLTLISSPTADYEITEFITLLPQSAYPFEVLPSRLIEMLFLDGEKRVINFPYQPSRAEQDRGILTQVSDPRPVPRVYRFFSEKRDTAAAIYFSPRDVPVVQQVFKPFYDRGEMVTPGYWGNHWPLGRGAPTGGAIDQRVHVSPAHVSTFGWGLWSGGNRPTPIESGDSTTIDALGRSRKMLTQRWSWLIAKTDAPDDVLLRWAQSYSAPPSLEIKGARLAFPSYSMERRAMRLIAETPSIDIKVKPLVYVMNPVFEIEDAPQELTRVTFDDRSLPADAYAWDGATLWVRAGIGVAGARIGLDFR
jgi:hypothetical protein